MMLNSRYLLGALILTLLAMPAAQAASMANGGQIYAKECSICHGQNGMSTMPGAPNFKFGHSLTKTDQALVEHLQNGRNACPSFMGILREREMYDVVSYLRTFYP